MSEYLWDKTGEAEEDVERLEELLSEFRHRPRALELPPEAGARAAVRVHASRVYRPAGFAFAAVLLFVVLAGALFVLRRGAGVGEGRREQDEIASQDSPSTTRQDSPRPSPPPRAAAPRPAKRAVSGKPERGQGGVGEVVLKQREGMTRAAFSSEEHERVAAGATPRVVAEAAPLEERRRLAKDDLMYVLRLTGLKLKEVQRRTQNVDGWKSAFDEQKPKQVTGKP